MLMFPAKIKPEGRVIVRSRDFHRRYVARMLLFEKPIKHFQKQGFGSMYGIGEFRIFSTMQHLNIIGGRQFPYRQRGI